MVSNIFTANDLEVTSLTDSLKLRNVTNTGNAVK